MRELDFEQQEQLANLKAFWESNRLWILVLLSVVLVTVGGYKAWQAWQVHESAQAVVMFESAEKAVEAKRWADVLPLADSLREKYPRSPYAAMTALMAARAVVEQGGKLEDAQPRLRWVIDHHQANALAMVARLRLSALLAEQKALDEALTLLPQDDQALGKDQAGFAGLVADQRGDILMAMNKPNEARLAYARAVAVMDAKDPWRQVVQVKLDSLPE